jgi:cell division protein FtsL
LINQKNGNEYRETRNRRFRNNAKRFSGKKLTAILISMTTFLVILIIMLGWLLYDRRQEAEKLETVTYEKFELISELQELSREYDDLMTDNVSMNLELEGRQEEIDKLIE